MAIKTTFEVNTYERRDNSILRGTGSIKFVSDLDENELVTIDFGGGEVAVKMVDLRNMINAARATMGLTPLVLS